jgi:transposase-like protein
MKAVASDLKSIYQSITIGQAEGELLAFGEKWDVKYPAISRSWTNHWQNIVTLFAFPPEIRKIIYTTNAIESLNSVIRKSINNRKIFPNDQSVLKVIYLAIQKASQKWTMSVHDWRTAMNRFAIEFDSRIS